MTNGHVYPNLQGLFANYVNLRPDQNWGLLQLTRTKHKANTFNVLCIARATTSLPPIPNVVQGSPLASPPPFFPSPFPPIQAPLCGVTPGVLSLGVLSIGGRRGIGARPTHGALPMRILLFHIGNTTAPQKAVAPVVNPLLARVTESPIFCFPRANSVSTRACGAIAQRSGPEALHLAPCCGGGARCASLCRFASSRSSARRRFSSFFSSAAC